MRYTILSVLLIVSNLACAMDGGGALPSNQKIMQKLEKIEDKIDSLKQENRRNCCGIWFGSCMIGLWYIGMHRQIIEKCGHKD